MSDVRAEQFYRCSKCRQMFEVENLMTVFEFLICVFCYVKLPREKRVELITKRLEAYEIEREELDGSF